MLASLVGGPVWGRLYDPNQQRGPERALAANPGLGGRMRSIGLTGGIASGKSTVTGTLADLGATIIDADRLGHRTYEPGTETFAQVVAAFGADIVGEDGTIDRPTLGGKVFGEPGAMTRLTDIVWPGIAALAVEEMAAARAAGERRGAGRWDRPERRRQAGPRGGGERAGGCR